MIAVADDDATLLYRSMERQDDRPRVGRDARSLGVREEYDIEVDEGGMVEPGVGGMSVSPEDILNLPSHRRPSEWGGTGKDPVWRISREHLGVDLEYRADPIDPTHGFIEPARTMEFNRYEEAIHATRESWVESIPQGTET